MKTITIRELHINTGQWVRDAAAHGPVIVTDRGRPVAEMQAFAPDRKTRARMPNREAAIKARGRMKVDSVVYQGEFREDR